MLRFIIHELTNKFNSLKFQYIPCYGLSRALSSSSVYFFDFNTSHVTVYLATNFANGVNTAHFNTSHVTVYLIPSSGYELLIEHFNTSHVTVYLFCPQSRALNMIISIHPMLRFIRDIDNGCCGSKVFQYIPCYGLSNDFKPFLSWHLSSFPLFYVISAFFTSRL